jgi:hypothetical protein
LKDMPSFLRAGARVVVTGLLVASPLLVARDADAYCRTTTVPVPASYSPTKGCFTQGLPLFWRNACISYSPARAASSRVPLDVAAPLFEQAFAKWTGSTCASGGAPGIAVSATEPVDCAEVRYNQNGPNQNVIVFRDADWPYSDPNNTLGLTTVTFNADTGEIYDADMEINASGKNLTVGDPVPIDGFDLLSVVTHEAGHFLGLAHATSSSSTMFASYKPGTTSLRSLADDDVAGLCEIYPSSTERNVAPSVENGVVAATACDPTPRHGFGTACEENAPPDDGGGGSCSVGAPGERSSGAGVVASAAFVLGLGLVRGARRRAATGSRRSDPSA